MLCLERRQAKPKVTQEFSYDHQHRERGYMPMLQYTKTGKGPRLALL